MKARSAHSATWISAALLSACGLLSGCNNMPGQPKSGPEVPRPQAIMDFKTLYGQNCAGCHGNDGRNGAAIALNNPEYQAIVDEAALLKWTAQGEPGTLMPGFAKSSGGTLEDNQVEAIVKGMRGAWYKAGTLVGQNPPPYAARKPGDPRRGQQAFTTFCASCHQPGQRSGKTDGSITNPSYLALISDQSLRTIIIAGRPDIGQPDWRNDVQGKPMSDQEITDVVAWLASLRSQTPGQPYPQHQ